jgi:hypothetical protein
MTSIIIGLVEAEAPMKPERRFSKGAATYRS